MHYQESDHPKWRAVKHLFEPDDKFDQSKVDAEGASSAPRAMDGTNLFENSSPVPQEDNPQPDAEAMQVEEAARVAYGDDEATGMAVEPDEDKVADLFGFF